MKDVPGRMCGLVHACSLVAPNQEPTRNESRQKLNQLDQEPARYMWTQCLSLEEVGRNREGLGASKLPQTNIRRMERRSIRSNLNGPWQDTNDF